jgi:two-component system sensor histidine kinase ResE
LDFSLKGQQGTRVYIFDEEANLIAYTVEDLNDENVVSDTILQYGAQVIDTGDELVSTKWRSDDGVVVGVAITDNMERIIGAILMSRPTYEVYSSLMSFVRALVLSAVIAALGMVIPAYFISRRMTNPIRGMMRASMAMAGGDFSVQADENREDEIGQLGIALNHLSNQLRRNISDLILARNRLHMILDGLHEGVIALEADNSIIYKNQSACQLLGACENTQILNALKQVLPLCETVRNGAPAQSITMDVGESKLLMVVSVSQETSDVAPGTVIVVQDVTAAERLEQTRKDYVANVSHELRTPIASIRSLAETLNDNLVKSEEDRSRYYGYILRESLRMTRLINDLLELSRLQSGAIALEKTPFDLCGLVDEVAEQMEMIASYSGIRIRTCWNCEKPLSVLSNRDRIEQVMIALVDNAIKYASDEGTITLDIGKAPDGTHALVSVMNTGHIDAAHLPHLFERFYKADASHSEGGTGLGLAIVKEVLTHLGESIVATNEGDNAVFRFSVSLCENSDIQAPNEK